MEQRRPGSAATRTDRNDGPPAHRYRLLRVRAVVPVVSPDDVARKRHAVFERRRQDRLRSIDTHDPGSRRVLSPRPSNGREGLAAIYERRSRRRRRVRGLPHQIGLLLVGDRALCVRRWSGRTDHGIGSRERDRRRGRRRLRDQCVPLPDRDIDPGTGRRATTYAVALGAVYFGAAPFMWRFVPEIGVVFLCYVGLALFDVRPLAGTIREQVGGAGRS